MSCRAEIDRASKVLDIGCDPVAAFRDIARALRPGGSGVVGSRMTPRGVPSGMERPGLAIVVIDKSAR
ncbi:hypothetical protein [Saccharopolyspora sp. NPDC002376]